MSDLRVMAFPGEDTADQVLNTLQALQKGYLIDFLVRHATQDKVLPEVRPFGGAAR